MTTPERTRYQDAAAACGLSLTVELDQFQAVALVLQRVATSSHRDAAQAQVILTSLTE